jgi:hypothetical protein
MSPSERRTMAYTWPDLGAHNLAEWIQRQAEGGLNSGVEMTLVHPGVVLESSAPRFPNETRFTLQREGKGSITLTIQRGDERWTATNEDLKAIPDDLRPWAERLLNTANSRTPLLPQLPPNVHLLLPAPMQPLRQARPTEKLEQQNKNRNTDQTDLYKRLDELSRQMDALREAIRGN